MTATRTPTVEMASTERTEQILPNGPVNRWVGMHGMGEHVCAQTCVAELTKQDLAMMGGRHAEARDHMPG